MKKLTPNAEAWYFAGVLTLIIFYIIVGVVGFVFKKPNTAVIILIFTNILGFLLIDYTIRTNTSVKIKRVN